MEVKVTCPRVCLLNHTRDFPLCFSSNGHLEKDLGLLLLLLTRTSKGPRAMGLNLQAMDLNLQVVDFNNACVRTYGRTDGQVRMMLDDRPISWSVV